MMIVNLEYSRILQVHTLDEDDIYDTFYGSDVFRIDTDKVIKALENKELYYSEGEMKNLLKCIENNTNILSDGGEKYSLYDTEWEYALVKADENIPAVKTLYRNIYV